MIVEQPHTRSRHRRRIAIALGALVAAVLVLALVIRAGGLSAYYATTLADVIERSGGPLGPPSGGR